MPATASAPPNELGVRPIGALIAKFAAPSIVAMLVMSLYNIVDQLFIGHGVGYLGNAATNIVFPITVMAIALSMLIGEGSAALYSIRLGEGKQEEARQYAGNAIILLFLIGLSFAASSLLFLHPLLAFLGAPPAVLPHAVDYAGPIILGIPFLVVGAGLASLIRANGSPAFAMKIMILGAVLNTALDPLLIFTFGMGVKGAAIATAFSQITSSLLAVSYLFKTGGFELTRAHFRPDRVIVGKIMFCGLAPSLSQMAVMIIIIILNKSLIYYGSLSPYGAEIPLAAHGVAMKVYQVLFAVLIGIAIGSQPIIGYNYGAGNFSRVKKTFFTATSLATAVAVAASCIFFFPQGIISLFGSEEALYNEFARKCFRIFLFATALNGFTVMAAILFQSMARVVRAAALQLSRHFLFMTPLLAILTPSLGVDGILYSGPLTDLLAFVLALALVGMEFRRLRAPGPAAEQADR